MSEKEDNNIQLLRWWDLDLSVIALSYLTHDLDMFYLYLTAKYVMIRCALRVNIDLNINHFDMPKHTLLSVHPSHHYHIRPVSSIPRHHTHSIYHVLTR